LLDEALKDWTNRKKTGNLYKPKEVDIKWSLKKWNSMQTTLKL
jgi:hypothetical protein